LRQEHENHSALVGPRLVANRMVAGKQHDQRNVRDERSEKNQSS